MERDGVHEPATPGGQDATDELDVRSRRRAADYGRSRIDVFAGLKGGLENPGVVFRIRLRLPEGRGVRLVPDLEMTDPVRPVASDDLSAVSREGFPFGLRRRACL